MSSTSTTDPGLVCRGCGRAADGAPGDLCADDGGVLVSAAAVARFADDQLLGRVLGHDLRVFDVLSDSGGFGRVYLAFQPTLARVVVVKVLRPEAAARPEARARLLREARALARLSHVRSVVTVHDCFPVDDQVCLVMERAPGQTLSRLLDAGPLPLRRALAVLRSVLEALQAAHQEGLVHRDLKPDNILVEGDTVTLIDFGIAKDLGPGEDDLRTASGVHLGTPRYMAPEQLQRDGRIGPHTDVYAAGVLLHELVTGRTPFEGSAVELVTAHLYEPPPQTGDASVDAVIQRAMHKASEDRFPSAQAMADALGQPPPARRPPTPTRTQSVEDLPPEPVAPRDRRGWVVVVAAACLGLGVGLGLLFGGNGQEGPGEAVAMSATSPRDAAAMPTDVGVPDTAVQDMAVADAALDQGRPDAIADAGPPRVAARRPVPKSTRRPTRRVTPRPAAPEPEPAPPVADPAQVRALRNALRVCRCDQAKKILTGLTGTADHKRWRAAVAACRPKLIGQACAYTEP